MADDDMNDDGGFLERVKESPRTVSALIIILIVAAAIYAFSGDEQTQTDMSDDAGVTVGEEFAAGEEYDAGEDMDDADDHDDDDDDSDEMVAGEVVVEKQELPAATRTEDSFVEVAQAGDGVTHLARRATTRWLGQNAVDYTVTNEHRIYIEDYVKDALAMRGLALGQEVPIPFSLIAEAVAAAGELDEKQLMNLTKYANNVTF